MQTEEAEQEEQAEQGDETEEKKIEIVQLPDKSFQAQCTFPQCGWKSTPKTDRLSAVRAASAHSRTCRSMPQPGGTPAEEEKPLKYGGDLQIVNNILDRYGVSKDLRRRLLHSLSERPQFLSAPSDFEDLLEGQLGASFMKQRFRGATTIRLIVQEVFEMLDPRALRGYSVNEFSEGTRPREFYPAEGEGDREAMKEKDRAIEELTAKVHQMELAILRTDLNAQLALRDDRIERLEAAVSQTPPGKSLIDVADRLTDKVDKRFSEAINLVKKQPGQFSPEVKRTPQERQAAAATIQGQLEKREKVLEAENELLAAFYHDLPQKEKERVS